MPAKAITAKNAIIFIAVQIWVKNIPGRTKYLNIRRLESETYSRTYGIVGFFVMQ